MASRKELIRITYHDDDDTGLYEIDELDFGITTGEVKDYCERNKEGRKNIVAMLLWLADQVSTGSLGTK